MGAERGVAGGASPGSTLMGAGWCTLGHLALGVPVPWGISRWVSLVSASLTAHEGPKAARGWQDERAALGSCSTLCNSLSDNKPKNHQLDSIIRNFSSL